VATIYEVAKRAGVVDRDRLACPEPPDVVARAPAASVLQAVERLGFTPNAISKSLRTMRTGKVIVTVPDIANPFFSLILKGIEDAARREGYNVLVGDTQNGEEQEERYAEMLKRKEADGLIFLGHRLPKEAASLMKSVAPRCAPIVNGCEFSPRLGIPSVHIDNAKAAREAMAHLYSLGHRRIGIVTGPLQSPLSRDRLEGATAQAKKQGAERDFFVMNGDFSIESGAVAAARLLRAEATADGHLLLQRRDGDGRLHDGATAKGIRIPTDLPWSASTTSATRRAWIRRSRPSRSRCVRSARAPCAC
jgi:LacI family repressor for deo operon, udp, cdd, tsx, nupC, and nupG